jgi:hypothetical protein
MLFCLGFGGSDDRGGQPAAAARPRSRATGMANTSSRASPAGRGDGRAALATERQRGVAVHKKCVIWLTITPACRAIDAREKSARDQGRQLAGLAVIDPLLVRNSACREMTNATRSRTVHFGPKKAKQNRIHGPACERGLRTATTPPRRRRAAARSAARASAVVPERDGTTRS